MNKVLVLFFIVFGRLFLFGANQNVARGFRKMAHEKSLAHYSIAYLRQVADTIVANQFTSGGWSKDQEWHVIPVSKRELLDRKNHRKAMARDGVGSTIDNGATTCELLFLCKVYHLSPDLKYRASAIRAIEYLLNSQYPCGGWPQFWPSRTKETDSIPNYADHITFNDNAIINVMYALLGICERKEPYIFLNIDDVLYRRCQNALDKGIQCILNLQYRIKGKPTVWCQQYDEFTFEPVGARKFERAGLCGNLETIWILDFLMKLPNPDKKIIESVTYAIDWLQANAIKDCKIETYINEEGKKDKRLVVCKGGDLLWARYYDLNTLQPFYSDYYKKIYDYNKMPRNRRLGYLWIDNKPAAVIKRAQIWLKKKLSSKQIY
jgi:pectinesterase